MPQRKASRYELVNIGFVNWYLFVVQDIPVYGSIAIVGHNGAGKSAIIDGMQVALTGNSKNAFRLNAAAQERRASERTVKSYCLGTMASADGDRVPRTARADAITYILLGFKNSASNREVTVGICLTARADTPDERIEGLFVLKGQILRAEDVVTRGVDEDGEFVEPLTWSAASARLRAAEGLDLLVNATADMHVRELCHALSPGGVPIQHRKFLRTLKAGLRFNPETIESATNFVRNFILDGEKISLAAVRQSIETYRTIQLRIDGLVRRLDSLRKIRQAAGDALSNARNHRRLQLRAEVGKMVAARAASVHETGKAEDAERLLASVRRELEFARSRLAAQRTVVDGLRAAMAADSRQIRLKSLDFEEASVRLEIKEAGQDLRFLSELAEWLPTVRAIAQSQRAGLVGLLDALQGSLSAEPARDVGVVQSWSEGPGGSELTQLAERLDRRVAEAERGLSEAEDEVQALRTNLERAKAGQIDLKLGTITLMRALHGAGVEAVPLCERVLRVNSDWQRAIEAFLGDRREALLVPQERYMDAFEIQRCLQGRGGRIINTTKTAETRAPRPGSVAQLVETDDPDARAFLDYVLGGVMPVDTAREFAGHESALTRDLMVQGGRVSSRLESPQDLKLGTGADGTGVDALSERLAQAEAGLVVHRRRRDEARAAQRAVERFADAVAGCGSETAAAALEKLEALRRQLARLEDERRRIEDDLDQDLRKRLDEAEGTLFRLDAEKDRLVGLEGATEGSLQTARDQAVKAAQQAEGHLSAAMAMVGATPEYLDENAIASAIHEWEGHAFHPMALAGEPQSFVAAIGDMSGRMVDDALLRRDSTHRATIAWLLQYWRDFDLPQPNELADLQNVSIGAIVEWLGTERSDLEDNRLLAYRSEARVAHQQAMDTFRNEYVRRMHDAFTGMKQRLADLNRQLRDRDFHGYRYSFDHIESRDYRDFVALVNRAADPGFDLPLFGSEVEDSVFGKALARLTELAADPHADLSSLEDPGLYHTYEIQLQDIRTGQRLSLSSRLGTASGGEGQAPYYVAIGSAFCSTYQGRSPDEFGMALTIFDEAFSKLDGKTVRECSAFLGGLGLQVIMAAPDEKRLTFLGIADTIVSVNRDDMRVQLDVQHPRQRLRDAIAEEDPRVAGLDGFRARMEKETPREGAPGSANREAAE